MWVNWWIRIVTTTKRLPNPESQSFIYVLSTTSGVGKKLHSPTINLIEQKVNKKYTMNKL